VGGEAFGEDIFQNNEKGAALGQRVQAVSLFLKYPRQRQ